MLRFHLTISPILTLNNLIISKTKTTETEASDIKEQRLCSKLPFKEDGSETRFGSYKYSTSQKYEKHDE